MSREGLNKAVNGTGWEGDAGNSGYQGAAACTFLHAGWPLAMGVQLCAPICVLSFSMRL